MEINAGGLSVVYSAHPTLLFLLFFVVNFFPSPQSLTRDSHAANLPSLDGWPILC